MELRQLLDDPAARDVLIERARALARREETAAAESGTADLNFRLGEQRFTVPATAVREVQPLGDFTALPAVPPFIVGLVNVRGRLVAAVDLRPLLGLPAAPPLPHTHLLTLAVADGAIGLIADAVTSVRRREADLAMTPVGAGERAAGWVRGVDARLSIHLDVEQLCADPALLVDSGREGAEPWMSA